MYKITCISKSDIYNPSWKHKQLIEGLSNKYGLTLRRIEPTNISIAISWMTEDHKEVDV